MESFLDHSDAQKAAKKALSGLDYALYCVINFVDPSTFREPSIPMFFYVPSRKSLWTVLALYVIRAIMVICITIILMGLVGFPVLEGLLVVSIINAFGAPIKVAVIITGLLILVGMFSNASSKS